MSEGLSAMSKEQRLLELAQAMVTMLGDLHSDYPWDQLHMPYEDIMAEAKELGLEVPPYHE